MKTITRCIYAKLSMFLGGSICYIWLIITVVDPGPRGGETSLLFCKMFAENCMKMKKIDCEGGVRASSAPFDLPMY